MTSQDDPEARIRDLERTLGEQSSELTSSTAEIGARPDPSTRVDPLPAYQQPPPAWGAQAPYGTRWPYGQPPPPARPAGTNWLLYGVLAGVVAAIVVGAVTFFSTLFSSVDSFTDAFRGSPTVAVPPVSGGGGPFAPNGEPPRIPVIAPTDAPVPPGGAINVAGVGQNRTIACADHAVNVSGVSNTLVITGQCASVTVSGMQNTITVESSVLITTSGMDNRVTYLSGNPQIVGSGDSNVVERG